ncbi:MAG: malto-oligosyltrehalose synthase [Acidimicrobiales bacterium]
MSTPRPLGSTYRLQLNGLGFQGARKLVGYLNDLGIETLYLSPILEAVPGSSHGYDVVNPTRLDPALGTPDQFEALLVELDAHDMRALIDIVPNHMACHEANEWWWDVLRSGQESPFALTFDIDWSRHVGRVLVPTLPSPLSDLADTIDFVGEGPARVMDIAGQHFPLAPGTHTGSDLHTVLARQHYRPAFWRLSNHEGNYRRFFDIDGLIGVRVELSEVFDRTHNFMTTLSDDERIAGWRVDHVDGLTDPSAYLDRLADVATSRRVTRPLVLVEKILARDERLPTSWRTDGTTGYEFADVAGGLFVSERGARQLADVSAALAGESVTFDELEHSAKREALFGSFDASLERLARLSMQSLNELHPGHDLSWFDVRRALTEITVHLDVYRTYFTDSRFEPVDCQRLERAARAAAQSLSGESRRATNLITHLLSSSKPATLELIQRWQQLSSADMAKGGEDTATYRYLGLLSHAEVGCNPDHSSAEPAQFHRLAADHLTYPFALNATSTHDSKRNEDSRARLFTLSELPDEWATIVRRWHKRLQVGDDQLGAEDELRVYQSFVCLWPHDSSQLPQAIVRRVQDYAVKAAREAKLHTSWTDPVVHYERSLRNFVRQVASDERFVRDIGRFVRRIDPAAVTNSLATVVLKCVAPGIPDFYQGTELFESTLTDPDNRRPVNYSRRRTLLAHLPDRDADETTRSLALRAMVEKGDASALKMFVTRELLRLRKERRELFAYGSYQVLPATGSLKGHVVAVARRHDNQWVIACVSRQTMTIAGPGRYPTGNIWTGTKLPLGQDAPTDFVDVLTGATLSPQRGRLDVAECFDNAPVSILIGAST